MVLLDIVRRRVEGGVSPELVFRLMFLFCIFVSVALFYEIDGANVSLGPLAPVPTDEFGKL